MSTTTDRGTAAQFLSALPFTIPILWQGQSGLHEIDDERRATLTIATHTTAGHYVGVRADIGSKLHGPITSKFFPFDDHLTGRADDRADYPLGNNKCFMVIEHCGWGWYIAVPAHPEEFTQAVEAWLDGWR